MLRVIVSIQALRFRVSAPPAQFSKYFVRSEEECLPGIKGNRIKINPIGEIIGMQVEPEMFRKASRRAKKWRPDVTNPS